MSSFLIMATDDGINVVDGNGMRQGYWIIKGYMADDPAYNPNNTVEEGNYKNNLKEGVWKRYYPNGKLRSEIMYEANRPNGKYSIYYENGVLEETGTWARNKNTGSFKRYHSNGNLQQEFFFAESGKRNGVQRYFHENGQLALEVNIVNGKEEGEMRRFNEAGKLIEVKVLNDGVLKPGSIKTFEKSPVVIKEDKKPEATKTQVTEKHTPNEAYKFEPDGYNVLYNEQQQVTQIGQFKNGRLWEGKWYRYNQDGILARIEIYRNGKYIGTGIIDEEDEE
jgi:antitoxin component YwqK of YwqJK toxin-antitoxin module